VLLFLEAMNFTPNPTNTLLTGRIQQQIAPTPPTTSSSTSQAVGMQNSNLPSPAFSATQQVANMPQNANNDNKNAMTPSIVQHQIQQVAQNNNNHGIGGVPQHLIAVQHQNINRLNIAHQPTFQQQPQPVLDSRKIMYEQLQNAYKQTLGGPASQAQHIQGQSSLVPGQQNILQKLQHTVSSSGHQSKQGVVPQQAKPLFNQSPAPISQQSIQLSPPKPVHPQMKTTAKLASPGSQLQGLQKLTTASNIFPTISPQNKTVPSTPQMLSQASTAALILNVASTPAVSQNTNISTVKTTIAGSSPVRQTSAVPVAQSQPVSTAASTTSSMPSDVLHSPSKGNEQPKETVQSVSAQSKSVPKPSVEEKPIALSQPIVTSESNTKPSVEKTATSPVAAAVTVSPSPEKPVVATTSSLKAVSVSSAVNRSTMRLATVTPARQKKPPPTNNKKPQPAPAVQSTLKSLAATPTVPSTLVSTPQVVKAADSSKSSVKKTPSTPVTPKATVSSPSSSSTPGTLTPKTKRSRVKVQPYQIPTPEIAFVTKLSTQTANSNGKSGNDDKLTIFYK
jgi:hypothetical protein